MNNKIDTPNTPAFEAELNSLKLERDAKHGEFEKWLRQILKLDDYKADVEVKIYSTHYINIIIKADDHRKCIDLYYNHSEDYTKVTLPEVNVNLVEVNKAQEVALSITLWVAMNKTILHYKMKEQFENLKDLNERIYHLENDHRLYIEAKEEEEKREIFSQYEAELLKGKDILTTSIEDPWASGLKITRVTPKRVYGKYCSLNHDNGTILLNHEHSWVKNILFENIRRGKYTIVDDIEATLKGA